MAKLRNPWGDGREADVLAEDCVGRPCLWVGEDKGSYTPGRGYTSYHKKPRLVCWTRHQRGCPTPLPDIEPELVRCCPAPDFPRPGKGRKPRQQRCRLCHRWAKGPILEIRRALPHLEHVKCPHEDIHHEDVFGGKWYCRTCGLYWDHHPKEYEPGVDFRTFLDRACPSVESK